jgi:fatty acid desaturase
MILIWDNYAYFSATHWLHHKITLDEKDPKSLFKDKINLFTFIQLLSFDFSGFLTKIKYLLQNSFNFIPKSKSEYLFPNNSENRKKVVYAARTILFFHIFTISIFIYINIWWLIFLINFAPFTISFFNRFLGYAQHYGLTSENTNDYFSNSRTIVLSKFWSFFYSNMNYHIEHHMYPHIPYYSIEKIHSELKDKEQYKNISIGWFGLLKDLNRKGIFDFKL